MTDPTFRTADGRRVQAVTADEMREVDRVAVQAFGIDVLQMMENAGRTLARQARDIGESVTVLAGSGGNGGGGLAAARHLANRGADVRAVLDRPFEDLDGAAAHHAATLRAMDVPIEGGPDDLLAGNTDRGDDTDRTGDAGGSAHPDVVVDALVGYGLSGPLRGTAAEMVEVLESAAVPVLSLDVPSGLDATTGERPGPSVDPARTLTLALPKTGLADVSDLVLADIGLPAGVFRQVGVDYASPFDDDYWVAVEAE